MLRLSPPLVISQEQVGLVLNGLADLCEQIERRAGATLMRGMGWTDADAVEAETASASSLPPPAPRAAGRAVPSAGGAGRS